MNALPHDGLVRTDLWRWTGAVGRQVLEWQRTLEKEWPALRFGEVKVNTDGGQYVIEVQVYLNALDPQQVRVELYADGANGNGPVRQAMARVRESAGTGGGYVYGGQVPATRPAADYTVRVVPQHSGISVPLEAARILWQR